MEKETVCGACVLTLILGLILGWLIWGYRVDRSTDQLNNTINMQQDIIQNITSAFVTTLNGTKKASLTGLINIVGATTTTVWNNTDGIITLTVYTWKNATCCARSYQIWIHLKSGEHGYYSTPAYLYDTP